MVERKVSEKQIEVIQKASRGQNTQIGVQNNSYGISPSEAVEIAFGLFREQFPKFKEEMSKRLEECVQDELSKIEPTSIVEPKARIVLPAIQNGVLVEEENLRRMYAKLLARSLDQNTTESVHPAYTEIINQMSHIDAKVLKTICDINDSIPVVNARASFDNQYLTMIFPHFYSPSFSHFEDKWSVSTSLENLSRLRVIELFEGRVLSFDYGSLKEDPFIKERFEFATIHNPTKDLSLKLNEYTIQTNDFGRTFMKICC